MALSLVAGAVFPSAHRSSDPSAYVEQALVNMLGGAHAVVEKNLGYSFDRGSCIYVGYVRDGGSVTMNRTFKRGQKYLLIGSGDDDAVDVDLQILQGGRIVAQDTLDDAAPTVAFTPAADGEYSIKLILADGDDDSFLGLCCLSDSGWKIPLESLGSTIDNFIRQTSLVDEELNGEFQAAPNTWCVYGGVADKDSDWFAMTNIVLSNPPYAIVGAAQDDDIDIDLELRVGNRLVDEDKEDDGQPVLLVEESGTYQIRLINESSQPALTMFGILRLPKS